jgi:uncharacterized cysteine cluster protein YcgN (CxxCxxCC family)
MEILADISSLLIKCGNLCINKFIMDLDVKNLYFGVVLCPMSRYDTAE